MFFKCRHQKHKGPAFSHVSNLKVNETPLAFTFFLCHFHFDCTKIRSFSLFLVTCFGSPPFERRATGGCNPVTLIYVLTPKTLAHVLGGGETVGCTGWEGKLDNVWSIFLTKIFFSPKCLGLWFYFAKSRFNDPNQNFWQNVFFIFLYFFLLREDDISYEIGCLFFFTFFASIRCMEKLSRFLSGLQKFWSMFYKMKCNII